MTWKLRKKPTGLRKLPQARALKPLKPLKPLPLRPVKPLAPLGYDYYWKPDKPR